MYGGRVVEDSDEDGEDGEDEEEVPRGVLVSRMPEDAYREALVRGEDVRRMQFGDLGSNLDEEEASQMLQEEDLIAHSGENDMDMDADLDADVPDAEEYEHTDTEEELSSSEEESVRGGFARQAGASMVRSDGTQNSLDFGSMISPGSSQMGSSPFGVPRAQPGNRPRRSGHQHQ